MNCASVGGEGLEEMRGVGWDGGKYCRRSRCMPPSRFARVHSTGLEGGGMGSEMEWTPCCSTLCQLLASQPLCNHVIGSHGSTRDSDADSYRMQRMYANN